MAILKPVLKPVFGPTITFILFRQRSGSAGGGPPPPPPSGGPIQYNGVGMIYNDNEITYNYI
jgi:hypothetical protein